jgi:hypothetical protein
MEHLVLALAVDDDDDDDDEDARSSSGGSKLGHFRESPGPPVDDGGTPPLDPRCSSPPSGPFFGPRQSRSGDSTGANRDDRCGWSAAILILMLAVARIESVSRIGGAMKALPEARRTPVQTSVRCRGGNEKRAKSIFGGSPKCLCVSYTEYLFAFMSDQPRVINCLVERKLIHGYRVDAARREIT